MLYFVATPIGNLKDITLRAIETLQEVDIIACEDTRKSLILLKHYNIKKRLISYHKNNEIESANGIIDLLKQGKNIAVISDCGMPVISDPGNILVKKLQENDLPYTIIPGANAGLSALVLSGFDVKSFTFIGFLPDKNKHRKEILQKIKNYETTLIFYISPHDITEVLPLLAENFGDRKACLVGEITKMFEKTIFFNLASPPEILEKGEFVLIIEKAEPIDNSLKNLSLNEQIEFYISSGLTKKQALKRVAKENHIDNIYTQI